MAPNRLARPVSIVSTVVLVMVLAASAISCGQAKQSSAKIGVAVTILPQAEFAESIGGDRINVTVMVPPGADPHTSELTPSKMTEVAEAKMYAKVGSGIEFELSYMDKIEAVNKNMLVVDCSKGIELVTSVDPNEPGMDPHIWVSPLNAKIMVQNICDGLVQVDPANKDYYEQNRDAYLQKLDALDQEIRSSLANIKNRAFIVLHPAWGYFARDYDLEQIPIEIGGKEPSAQDITRIIDEAKQRNIKIIFASPQFNPQMAEVIANEIGSKVVLIDDLARDYIENLRMVLNEMIQAME
jgi:zinc transport system substrate-binding protein